MKNILKCLQSLLTTAYYNEMFCRKNNDILTLSVVREFADSPKVVKIKYINSTNINCSQFLTLRNEQFYDK